MTWAEETNRRFESRIKILIHNQKGTLARIAAAIGEADDNIISVSMEDDGDQTMKHLRFTIQVEDRVHLARTMRSIRNISSVTRILRERN